MNLYYFLDIYLFLKIKFQYFNNKIWPIKKKNAKSEPRKLIW